MKEFNTKSCLNRVMADFLRLLQSGVNILFPSVCPVCTNTSAEYPKPVCKTCRSFVLAGESLPPVSSDHIHEIRSCRRYEGIARDCIKEFKYSRNKGMLNLFGEIIIKHLSEKPVLPGAIDLIIPVPLHWIRLDCRGYNQSELIAGVISGKLQTPISTRNLIKIKNTHPQSGLCKDARAKNIRNSFSVIHPYYVAGKSIMLVDDVMTTGATLDSCAKELLEAGARDVSAFTLARTL